MSAEWRQEEYLKITPTEALAKKKNNKINHVNKLLHFIRTILRGESYFFFLPFSSCIEALDVNYYSICRPQRWFWGELIPES